MQVLQRDGPVVRRRALLFSLQLDAAHGGRHPHREPRARSLCRIKLTMRNQVLPDFTTRVTAGTGAVLRCALCTTDVLREEGGDGPLAPRPVSLLVSTRGPVRAIHSP